MRSTERDSGAARDAARETTGGSRAGAPSSTGRGGVHPARGVARARPWVDPRFVTGVLLVVASIIGVWWLVTATGRTTPVYAAAETLTPGSMLEQSKLRVVETRLGAAAAGYLGADAPGREGLVVTRTIAAGELIPVAALDDAASLGVTTLVVQPSGRLGADIVTGAVVDLWAAAPIDDGYAAPEVLVPATTVVRTREDDGFLARDGSTSLELAVPRSTVAALLAATAAGHLLSVVPAEPGAR